MMKQNGYDPYKPTHLLVTFSYIQCFLQHIAGPFRRGPYIGSVFVDPVSKQTTKLHNASEDK